MRKSLVVPCLLLWAAGCASSVWPSIDTPKYVAPGVCGDLAIFSCLYEDYVWAVDTQTGRLAWTYDAGGQIGLGPCVSGGVAYFWWGHSCEQCADTFWERLLPPSGPCAVDCMTGRCLWRKRTLGFPSNRRPFVVSPLVLFPSCKEETYIIYAYDKQSGRLAWERPDTKLLGHFRRTLFCTDGHEKFLVLDANTGELLWQTSARSTWDIEEASVASNGDAVVVGFPDTIRCYEIATGKLLWQAPASSQYIRLAVEGPYCYAVDSMVSVDQGGPRLEIYELTTGRLVEKRELHLRSSDLPGRADYYPWLQDPVLHNGVLLLCYEDRVIAFDLQTGEQLWELRLWEIFDLSVSKGTVFIAGEEDEPAIYQLDVRTGKILWSQIGEPLP